MNIPGYGLMAIFFRSILNRFKLIRFFRSPTPNVLPNILHITHSWGGGIERYLSDLKEVLEDHYNFFLLRSNGRDMILEYTKQGKQQKVVFKLAFPVTILDFYNLDYQRIISNILLEYNIRIVHIESMVGHTFDVFRNSREKSIPVILTVHDFYYICPTFHLVDKTGVFCNGCKLGDEREGCLLDHPYVSCPDFDDDMLFNWRNTFLKAISCVDLFIFPSVSAKNIFSAYYLINDAKIRIISHGSNACNETLPPLSKAHESLRVGILGSIYKHKGEALLGKLLDNMVKDDIHFYSFGHSNLKSRNLTHFGSYTQEELPGLLRDHPVDVMLLLSTWPETFSYTLSESIAAGVPPIVTNLGAQKERIEDSQIGWIVDYKSPEKIVALLRFLRQHKEEIDHRRRRIKEYHLKSMEEMKEDYEKVYCSFI